jgi:hypothetical protein
MRVLAILLILGMSSTISGQRYDHVYALRYVQQAPVYPMGIDSAKRYYFNHFPGMDSLLPKAITNGDTLKYIRVYFSFVIDKYGLITEPHFIRIASTRYAQSLNARTANYFFEDEFYYEKAIKQMLRKMGFWKPALQNGIPVSCRIEDYFQFWVGTYIQPMY